MCRVLAVLLHSKHRPELWTQFTGLGELELTHVIIGLQARPATARAGSGRLHQQSGQLCLEMVQTLPPSTSQLASQESLHWGWSVVSSHPVHSSSVLANKYCAKYFLRLCSAVLSCNPSLWAISRLAETTTDRWNCGPSVVKSFIWSAAVEEVRSGNT